VSAQVSESPAGRYHAGLRRQAQRHGREKGCRVNIPMEELRKAGWDVDGPPPYYRVWRRAETGEHDSANLTYECVRCEQVKP
jgi:hypothetical protein